MGPIGSGENRAVEFLMGMHSPRRDESELGLRPSKWVRLITKFTLRGLSVEPPVDLDSYPVEAAVPSAGFPPQGRQIRDSSVSQHLRRTAQFQSLPVEPAAVDGM